MLTWEDSYAIALDLQARFPDIDLEEVSLGMIYRWTFELSDFDDDPDLANEAILTDILKEWIELVNSVSNPGSLKSKTNDISQQFSRR